MSRSWIVSALVYRWKRRLSSGAKRAYWPCCLPRKLLLGSCRAPPPQRWHEIGRRRPDLADATIPAHRRRLERQLERLLARKPTDAEGRKLRDAVYVDCSDRLFVFLKRRDAEP